VDFAVCGAGVEVVGVPDADDETAAGDCVLAHAVSSPAADTATAAVQAIRTEIVRIDSHLTVIR
jgi:hypothetical protein